MYYAYPHYVVVVVVVVVCLTLTLVKTLESVVTQRCWSPRKKKRKTIEINICQGNTALPRLKRTIRRGAQVK